MEFNGLVGIDFDFFKKKDKMTREEYESGRNEVKQHFRSLCYELQKIYHKKTGGVLELDKNFQNFNKRSNSIVIEHKNEINNFKMNIQLNSEYLSIELDFKSQDQSHSQYILDILKNKKNIIWEYMMANKYMVLYAEFESKNKKNNIFKITALDINNKNYENFISFIENNIKEEKNNFTIQLGYMYSKNECIKQGRNFVNTAYDAVINIMEMQTRLT